MEMRTANNMHANKVGSFSGDTAAYGTIKNGKNYHAINDRVTRRVITVHNVLSPADKVKLTDNIKNISNAYL